MKEKVILKTDLSIIETIAGIEQICRVGYIKTGHKFQVSFNGST